MRSTDTIFAFATPPGRSAVAVIRISGQDAGQTLSRLAGDMPTPRRAALRTLRDPRDGRPLDEALAIWFPAPGSFTGEDSVELHIHGGAASRSALVEALASLPSLRVAEAGEFTRRAFLNGKLDLSAVEGLADLIDAETEAQRRQALRQYGGALRDRVEAWRGALIDALAWLEAGLDFTDEDDIPDEALREGARRAAAVRGEIKAELARADHGERLRDGATVVISGPPNAGKSTLINALARREVAIVTPFPGTTRDALETRCDLDGYPVTLIDTAGLRDTDDPVEALGIERARQRAATADLVVWLDAPEAGGSDRQRPPGDRPLLHVASKSDLGATLPPGAELAISARDGSGLAALVSAVVARVAERFGDGETAIITRERHRTALTEVEDALTRAGRAATAGHGELAAEDVRLALRALGGITGAVDVEQVLDRVFSQFCIGK